eukprot:gene676-8177_t
MVKLDFVNRVAKQKRKFFVTTVVAIAIGVPFYEATLGLYGTWTGKEFNKKLAAEGQYYQWQMVGKDIIHEKYSSSIDSLKSFHKRDS